MAVEETTQNSAEISPETLADVLAELQRIREELRVAWEAIDELRECLDHALRNPPEEPQPRLHITSLALDPLAEDFGERINSLPDEIIRRLRAEASAGGHDASPPPTRPSQATEDTPPVSPKLPANGATHQLGLF
jgi:hypothetical protein